VLTVNVPEPKVVEVVVEVAVNPLCDSFDTVIVTLAEVAAR
jgi:hypothetical protein